MNNNSYYAVFSGACASAASLFGKLSGLPILDDLILLRVIFFALMVICNGGVWTFYVKALQAAKSSLTATVVSASTNYLLSAISGFLIFGEVTSLMWWTGTGLTLLGLILIVTESIKTNDQMLLDATKNNVKTK